MAFTGKVLYFDTETDGIGGFSPPRQRVVQIAWEYADISTSYLINDVQRISPHVPHVFQVQDCHRDGIAFEVAFNGFMAALRKCSIAVAHNINFDKGVLLHELQMRDMNTDEFLQLMNKKQYCTMQTTIDVCCIPKVGNAARYPGFKYPKLSELYVHLMGKEPTLSLHDASNDVQILKECFLILRTNALSE